MPAANHLGRVFVEQTKIEDNLHMQVEVEFWPYVEQNGKINGRYSFMNYTKGADGQKVIDTVAGYLVKCQPFSG